MKLGESVSFSSITPAFLHVSHFVFTGISFLSPMKRHGCIEKALLAPNIATQNVSEVVTDNFLCTGGRHPSLDKISCKGMFLRIIKHLFATRAGRADHFTNAVDQKMCTGTHKPYFIKLGRFS